MLQLIRRSPFRLLACILQVVLRKAISRPSKEVCIIGIFYMLKVINSFLRLPSMEVREPVNIRYISYHWRHISEDAILQSNDIHVSI